MARHKCVLPSYLVGFWINGAPLVCIAQVILISITLAACGGAAHQAHGWTNRVVGANGTHILAHTHTYRMHVQKTLAKQSATHSAKYREWHTEPHTQDLRP